MGNPYTFAVFISRQFRHIGMHACICMGRHDMCTCTIHAVHETISAGWANFDLLSEESGDLEDFGL